MRLHGKIPIISSLAHLIQRLKWAFLIKIHLLSVVVVLICRFIFFIFPSSFSETHGQLQPNFAQSIFESLRKDVYSKEGSRPFPRADNKKNVNYHWKILSIKNLQSPEPLKMSDWLTVNLNESDNCILYNLHVSTCTIASGW